MDIKSALETEIKYIDKLLLASLTDAEKKNDLLYGRIYRMNLKDRQSSYKRILASLNQET